MVRPSTETMLKRPYVRAVTALALLLLLPGGIGSAAGQQQSPYQVKITGQCAVGSSIREINADGTVVCQNVGTDTVAMKQGESGPFPINAAAGWVTVGSPLSVDPGSYVVSAAVNLVNQSASPSQIACLIGPDTVFGFTQHMRTTLPSITASGGAGHITLATAGSLPAGGTISIGCVNDTPGGVAHAENVTLVITKVQSVSGF